MLCIWIVIGFNIGETYHPNATYSQYSSAITRSWFISVGTSLIWCLIISFSLQSFSAKFILNNSLKIYAILLAIGGVLLLLVKPVPNSFIHIVGNQKYQVPREFTVIQDFDSGLSIDICVDTLQGVYSSHRGDCNYEQVTLSEGTILDQPLIQITDIFNRIQGFEVDNNDRIVLSDNAEKWPFLA